MAQYDIDIRDYWRIIKRRKSVVVLTVLLTAIFSYGFARFSAPPPLYEATASVKIEKVSSMANLFVGTVTWNSGDNIATQAAIITSFPVLAKAARRLEWIPESVTDEEIKDDARYMGVIEDLKRMIVTEQEKHTSIINITATSNDSNQAYLVAREVANSYKEFNKEERYQQTDNTMKFVERQIREIGAKLKDSEERLRSYKKDKEAVALQQQALLLMNQIDKLETDLTWVKKWKSVKSSELENLELTDDLIDRLTEAFHAENEKSLLRELSSRISLLTSKRQTLLLDYTPNNPQVIAIEGQIQGMIKEVKQEILSNVHQFELQEQTLLKRIEELKQEAGNMPDKALELAKLDREVALNQDLYKELQTKYQETLIQAAGKIDEVTIIRPPMESTKPVNLPSKLIATITGVVIGLILGMVLAFITETLDTSIGTIEDVEEYLQVPVLGVIPFADHRDRPPEKLGQDKAGKDKTERLITHFEPKSLTAEAFRSLRTNLQYIGQSNGSNTFLVTSSSLQEGKTFSASNLSLSMAQAGERVLLIEADLRRPSTYKMFGLEKEPGLSDYVLGNYGWRDVVKTITDIMVGDFRFEDVLKTPGLDNLHVITAGSAPPNPAEVLRSPRFEEFIKEAREEYDAVVVDATPILPVADATVIADKVDGVVIVYEVGKIARGLLKRAKMSMDNIDANVLGVILNNIRPDVSPDFYGYKYGYHGYYGTEDGGGKLPEGNRPGAFSALIAFVTGLFVKAGSL